MIENLVHLICSYNYLSEIKCNDNLQLLCCYNNPIIKLNRNDLTFISSVIHIYNNKYYWNKTKLEILNNKYFIRRFKKKNKILYVYRNYTIVYQNYTINYTILYKLLNEKYN